MKNNDKKRYYIHRKLKQKKCLGEVVNVFARKRVVEVSTFDIQDEYVKKYVMYLKKINYNIQKVIS